MTPQVHGSGHLTHTKMLIPSACQEAEGIGILNKQSKKKMSEQEYNSYLNDVEDIYESNAPIEEEYDIQYKW